MVLAITSNKALGETALYFPRLARGHGSLSRMFCNARGCDPSDPKSHGKHLQERFDLAQEYWNNRK